MRMARWSVTVAGSRSMAWKAVRLVSATIVVLSIGLAGSAWTVSAASPASQSDSPVAEPALATRLNLNTATEEEFRQIPGVGTMMVREFQEYRPYQSIRQFRREIGKYVSQAQVAEYEQYVFVPVNPNAADSETLLQLPGVDAAIAEQLVAGRPFDSNETFLSKLGEYVAVDDVTTASGYLVAP